MLPKCSQNEAVMLLECSQNVNFSLLSSMISLANSLPQQGPTSLKLSSSHQKSSTAIMVILFTTFSSLTLFMTILSTTSLVWLSRLWSPSPPPQKWGLMRMMTAFTLSLVCRWWWWWWRWYPEYLPTERIPIGIHSVGILGVCPDDLAHHHSLVKSSKAVAVMCFCLFVLLYFCLLCFAF